ncbi:hypothetical protein [Streptomyces smyrnaeus]|uniref:hypothetical protein n=1 Tax=Streptomyces smyrnaeus TaxID=1387713 RepID=UPI003408D00D
MSETPMTPEREQAVREAVLGEVVAWLVKKAREHRAKGPQYAKQADVIGKLASKVQRGAVRPDNLATLPPGEEPAPEDAPALAAEVEALRGQLAEACGGTSAVVERMRQQQERIAELEKRLHDAAMTRTWTNEDGKKFVFVEDVAPALLGYEAEGGEEREFVETPCGPAPNSSEPGGAACATHERLMWHAEGEHELCGPECGGTSAVVERLSRATVLREAADRMRREADSLPDAGQIHHKQVLHGGAIVLDRQADAAEAGDGS